MPAPSGSSAVAAVALVAGVSAFWGLSPSSRLRASASPSTGPPVVPLYAFNKDLDQPLATSTGPDVGFPADGPVVINPNLGGFGLLERAREDFDYLLELDRVAR